ncbi:LCP family protein [Spirillospora albida]|uniref:LCP family protein n=1 Tax=Spirillospora albida TaxID=58123 RepID=UPI00068922BE|nr:LCP family protein [Spirillospora albida]
MDDLELLRGLGRHLEDDPPATLVRQRRRLLDAARGGGRAAGSVRRPHRWALAGMAAAVTAALILVPAVLLGRGDPGPAATGDRPPARKGGALNVLLLGSDSRGRGGERSDTIVLMRIAADRRSAHALSLPRDTLVRLPSCEAPGRTVPARRGPIATAFTDGGIACAMKTVESLTGARVDRGVVVEFGGFKRMVSALGGVDVTLPTAVDDPSSGLRLPAGRHRLNGEQALAYVRARRGLGDGSDLQRIVRQQRFMASMARRAEDRRRRDPLRFGAFLAAAAGSVRTAPPLGVGGMRALADDLASIRTEEIAFSTAPVRSAPGDPNRLVLDPARAERVFAQFRARR